jgi:two-component system sensor histidine kinase PilS (NtrC family)
VKPRPLDTGTLLRPFCWARLAVAGVLVAVGPWAPAVFAPGASAGLLVAVVTLAGASSGILLLLGPLPRPRVAAWLLCLLDATAVTAVVAATGGARSIFVCLYVVLVTGACLLLSRSGALTIALISSGLYAALVLARNVVPALAFGEPVDALVALDVLTILVTGGTVTVVAIATGGLAERFLLARRELERERRTLGDLQAFSDVIFQSVETGLIALDRAHRITAFNRAAEAITGVPAATALGAGWTDVLGPGASVRGIEAVIAGDSPSAIRHEIELRRPDGTLVPVRVTVSALEAGDGARLGCIAACEDVSSVRAMEAGLRQADRLATLGRMAANIAHEVRNPLTSLSGAVEALTRADVAAEARVRLTRIILRESERLSEITRNFIEYAHPARLVIERVDAAVVLDDVLRALPEHVSPEGVKIVRAFPPSLPLQADRERLRQVLSTLCLNALGVMPGGGELRLEGRVQAGLVEIAVSDTGEGIPAHELAGVFEPFVATPHDATGLGLALVHRIVHEHRGQVTVRSEPGLGTEFVLRVPQCHA